MTSVAAAGAIKGLLAGLRLTLILFGLTLALWTVIFEIGDSPGDLPSALLAFVSSRAWLGFCWGASTILGSALFGAFPEMSEASKSEDSQAEAQKSEKSHGGWGCLTYSALSFGAGFLLFRLAAPHILRPGTNDMSPLAFASIGGGWTIMSGLLAVGLIPLAIQAYREGRY